MPATSNSDASAENEKSVPSTALAISTAKDEVIEAELIKEGIAKPAAAKAVRVMHRVVSQFHSGPLPSPETFAGYEQVCPGAAKAILDMAVRQQIHSHDMDREALRSEVSYRNAGIGFAGLIVLVMVAGTVWCANMGQKEVALLLGSVSGISLLAGVFIRGRGLFERSPAAKAPPVKAQVPAAQKKPSHRSRR